MELSFKVLFNFQISIFKRFVLILILMELSFKELIIALVIGFAESFNPYFNGTFF